MVLEFALLVIADGLCEFVEITNVFNTMQVQQKQKQKQKQ
jgi:hypothetical protein